MVKKEKHWYALYTKPRHEFKAEIAIREKLIEVYLPKIVVERKWSDRKKKVTEALFKSYIFVFADEIERINCLKIPSVIRTVCFNGKPSIIPDEQVENLKRLLEEKPQVFIVNKIHIGQRIKIIDGPFRGVEGVITEYKAGEKHLAVSIDLLKRSVLVRLSEESIIKIVDS